MKKPIVTYCRVANPESSITFERQRQVLQDHLERISAVAVEEFVDVGVPGTIVERAGLDSLLRHCRQHPGTMVLAESPVRVARNPIAYVEIVARLTATGAEIQFVEGQ